MFSRVSLRDQALALLATIGVLAGLSLLILGDFKVTGIIVIILGVTAATAVALRNMADPLIELKERQRAQRDQVRATVVGGGPLPLESVDPFAIGVFRSDLAEENARYQGAPEYVPRTLDAHLSAAFDETTLARNHQLVVLRGDPKAGKSRTLWEAVNRIEGRRLVALKAPDPFASSSEPAAEPLTTLLSLEKPLSSVEGRDLVIWIDDAHNHLDHGFSRENLRRLIESNKYPYAIIAVTIHSDRLDAIKDFDRELHALLREPFDDLFLEPMLDEDELRTAQEFYPGVAYDSELARLPEFFAGVLLLIDRYMASRASEPVGVAITAAAIAWQRAGLPPYSIDRGTLRDLTKLMLRRIAPAHQLTDEAFVNGLNWSMVPVAASAALVRVKEADVSDAELFSAFDAVVSWSKANERHLSLAIWEFILERVEERGILAFAMSAYDAQQVTTAENALIKAQTSTDARLVSAATFYFAELQKGLGKMDEAAATYRALIDIGDPDSAPMAAVGLGLLLKETGRSGEAKALFQLAFDSDHSVHAMAAVELGLLLADEGRFDEAHAAYRVAIESGETKMALKAMTNLGVLFATQGCVDRAQEAYRAVINSGHPDYAPAAMLNLGVLLYEHEQIGEAELALELAIMSGHSDYAPRAALNLGLLLKEHERAGEAEEVLRLAIKSGHPDHAPTAAFTLGGWLTEAGRLDDAETFYRSAIDSGHDLQVPQAAFCLGVLLEDRGRLADAEGAFWIAVDSGHPDLAPQSVLRLVLLLTQRGRWDEAKAALNVAIHLGHHEYGPMTALYLGLALMQAGRFDEAAAAYQLAIDSGHHEWAPKAAHHIKELPPHGA